VLAEVSMRLRVPLLRSVRHLATEVALLVPSTIAHQPVSLAKLLEPDWTTQQEGPVLAGMDMCLRPVPLPVRRVMVLVRVV